MRENRKRYIVLALLTFVLFVIWAISARTFLSMRVPLMIPQAYTEFIELRYVEIKNRANYNVEGKGKIKLPEFIAHAGGNIDTLTGTNSLEALNASYEKGFLFIELDFNWTTDNYLVLIHDWKESVNRLFSVYPKDYSLSEFRKFKMIKNLTQMTLDDLVNWLDKHPGVFIITDIKQRNVNGLKLISRKYKNIRSQIIPQIYQFTEYNPVRNLGFDNIILTLYKKNYSDDILLEFVKRYPVSAVTMPIAKAKTNLPSKLKRMNIFVYTHTVNQQELVDRLKANGVDGFYTDLLKP